MELNEANIKAKLKNGLLEIQVPKISKEESKPRRIEIKGATETPQPKEVAKEGRFV